MTDLEIPLEKDRHGHYRFFEILPGALSWTLLFTPLILSFINVEAAVLFVLLYLLIFFVRALAYSVRAIDGYRIMKQHMKLDWNGLCADIDQGAAGNNRIMRPKWHFKNLRLLPTREYQFKPSQLTHAVIVATVNESREVLEPTIQAILGADYDPKKIILVFAYEGRAGKPTANRVQELLNLYEDRFLHAMAVKHPANIEGEIIGKGGNISYAGRALQKHLKQADIDPATVLVTTLDSDNRPDKRYFAALSYLYCVVPKPLRASYQPLAMYTNNIWDAPTLMRVIATAARLRTRQPRDYRSTPQARRSSCGVMRVVVVAGSSRGSVARSRCRRLTPGCPICRPASCCRPRHRPFWPHRRQRGQASATASPTASTHSR